MYHEVTAKPFTLPTVISLHRLYMIALLTALIHNGFININISKKKS